MALHLYGRVPAPRLSSGAAAALHRRQLRPRHAARRVRVPGESGAQAGVRGGRDDLHAPRRGLGLHERRALSRFLLGEIVRNLCNVESLKF